MGIGGGRAVIHVLHCDREEKRVEHVHHIGFAFVNAVRCGLIWVSFGEFVGVGVGVGVGVKVRELGWESESESGSERVNVRVRETLEDLLRLS